MTNDNAKHYYIITKKKCSDIILLNKLINHKINFSHNKHIVFHFDRSDPSYKSLYTIINFMGKDAANIDSKSYRSESFKLFCTTSHIPADKKRILFIHKPHDKDDFMDYKNFSMYCKIDFKFIEYRVKRPTNSHIEAFRRNVMHKLRDHEQLKRMEINYDLKNDRVISIKVKGNEYLITEYQYLIQNIMLYLRAGIR